MTFTSDTSINTLIEQRIREQVKGEASPALAEFELTVEAAIKKLGVFAPMTPLHSLVRDVRTKHIDNLVARRVDALVNQLVLNDTKGQMVVRLDQTRMVSKSWSGAGVDALNVHEGERIIPQPSNPAAASGIDGAIHSGATLIVECDRALTDEQVKKIKAGILADLPTGCKVVVLHGGVKAAVSLG
ncbi:hypothetical protein BN2497_4159 [Janthinobacterium sp. CG23_2]|nr:hypothetical protein BN2497_4159 [Janthinobacterium sp. CG23_2]CUU28477.1 hypothetical protein BN3177_4159 [Janthinobacterium sp. CG23_2]